MSKAPSLQTSGLRRACIWACLVLALAGCGDRGGGRSISLTECRVPKLATAAQCGTLSVPENRAQAAGRRIGIAVIVLPANTLDPRPDPLFLLAGGPGQSAEALVPLAEALASVRRKRDLVLIDPR